MSPPDVPARFVLQDLIGSGSAGDVYRAVDRDLDRVVALKFLKSGPDEASRRVIAEARAAAAVTHPNVAAVHDVVPGPRPFIVMEHVAGETLEARLRRGPLSVSAAVGLASQLCAGLEAAGARGLVHGDLSARNVMVTPRGEAKIVDFGLAGAPPEGRTDLASGTPGYVAPERLLREEAGASVDVFAVGVLLYEMLSGRRPFADHSPSAEQRRLLRAEPAPLGGHGVTVPPGLELIVRRALEKDPRLRYGSCGDLRAALSSLPALRVGRPEAEPSPPPGPAFRGLLPFQEADRHRFYGRAREIEALWARVTHGDFRFGVLFGESGCGKSSLLAAGLVPRLWEAGHLVLFCRPHRDPVAALVEECERRTGRRHDEGEPAPAYLRRIAGGEAASVFMVVDQFEEFLVNVRDPARRAAFRSLVASAASSDPPLRTVLAVRSDFLYQVGLELEGVIRDPLASARMLHLANLDEGRAAEILERTAVEAGLPVEADLCRRVAADLALDGAVLPSELQIVGERMQVKGIFSVTAYEHAGGKQALVEGFLEEVLTASGDRAGAALLLQSLVSDDGTKVARTFEEVLPTVPRTPSAVRRLLRLLVQARLVRELRDGDAERFELVHEYLVGRIHAAAGQALDARARANRLLRAALLRAASGERVDLPLRDVLFIRRHADRPRGDRELHLLRRSLRRGILRTAALAAVLATASATAAAWLSVGEQWDETTLRDGHAAAARRVAFSPDGKRLASCGEDGRVIVWDFARRERAAVLTDHRSWVQALAFSPDGRWLASGARDGTVIVWDAQRLQRAVVLRPHRVVSAVAFSRDGRLLASADQGGGAAVWRVGDWTRALDIPYGAGEHGTVLFSPDGRRLYLSAAGLELDGSHPPLPLGLGDHLALDPPGRRLAAVDSAGRVTLADAVSGRVLFRDRAHRDHGRAAAFSPDGRWLATGAEDIVLWDARMLVKLARLGHPSIVWDLAFSPDGRWLVSSHGDGSVSVWDPLEQRRVADLREHTGPVRAVAFSPDGRHVASASEDRSIIVWDVAEQRKEAVLLAHDTRVMGVDYSRDGSWLASADQDGEVVLWDVAQRRMHGRLRPRDGHPAYYAAVSPDMRYIATTYGLYRSADLTGPARVVDPQRELGESGVFSRSGSWFVTASDVVTKWRTEGGAVLERSAPLDALRVALSPDEKLLAVGGVDGAVRLFGVDPLRELAILGRHRARVKAVAFSPDGRRLLSSADDGRILLWDIPARRLLAEVGTHTSPVLSLAFSPDGSRFVSGEHDSTVRVYTRRRTLWGRRLESGG